MTNLLIIAVVVLLGIAIWQLTKIFQLTQKDVDSLGIHESESEIATDNDNNINGYLMFGFMAFLYILMIYCCIKWGDLPLITNAASEHGKDYDQLMWITLGLIFFVQFVTQFLLHYFSFKNRGRKGRKALYFADNEKLEFIWTIIPVVVLTGLILYGLYAWNKIMHYSEEEEVLYVEVYAKQFGWDVRYAGADNTLGKANVRFIQGVNVTGADMSDPNSQDDVLANELHLPVGKKVVFKIRSQDIIHSAYFPHFRAQMNAVPGMVTQFVMVPTITTADMRQNPDMVKKVQNINKLREEKSKELLAQGKEALTPYEFDYLLLCNKICGASHYNMQMKVVVETEEEFKKWMSEQATLSAKIAEEKAGNAKPAATEATTAQPAEGEAAPVENKEAVALAN